MTVRVLSFVLEQTTLRTLAGRKDVSARRIEIVGLRAKQLKPIIQRSLLEKHGETVMRAGDRKQSSRAV